MKDKIIKFLNLIFAPRITYYSTENIDPKELKKVTEAIKKMNKEFDDFWKNIK